MSVKYPVSLSILIVYLCIPDTSFSIIPVSTPQEPVALIMYFIWYFYLIFQVFFVWSEHASLKERHHWLADLHRLIRSQTAFHLCL